MDFGVKSGSPEKQRTACIVVGVFQDRRLSDAATSLDEVCDGQIAEAVRSGDIEGRVGETLLLRQLPGLNAERVLLVGCGKERELEQRDYSRCVSTTATALAGFGAAEAISYLSTLNVRGRDIYWKVRQAVTGTAEKFYRFDELKQKKSTDKPLKHLYLGVSARKELAIGERAVRDGKGIADGVSLARDLGNLPGNVCTPTYLASRARKIARGQKLLGVEVLSEKNMQDLGMGSLLSVSRGSREPAKLIALKYRGAAKTNKPVVLVGKGVTFDAGGISIKPSGQMDEMKFDMCGAASVLAVMQAVNALQLPINVIGLVPATENLPDGDASKPGDIVTSMSGQTIEVLNTDAEGRLILCDALTYAKRFDPEVVIDIATLTGACVVALGNQASGLLSNCHTLADDLLDAGRSAGDRAWELPLWEEYQDQLKSNFADMANIGGREAGTITAACFLSRFTEDYDWAHLDIAGTAWRSGKDKGATGRPVGLLVQYLLDRAGSK